MCLMHSLHDCEHHLGVISGTSLKGASGSESVVNSLGQTWLEVLAITGITRITGSHRTPAPLHTPKVSCSSVISGKIGKEIVRVATLFRHWIVPGFSSHLAKSWLRVERNRIMKASFNRVLRQKFRQTLGIVAADGHARW